MVECCRVSPTPNFEGDAHGRGLPQGSWIAIAIMPVPQIVIVGRPNVGKSSLFNWLAGTKIAIVDDKPGITRDRITHLMCHDDRFFELVDTGGMGFNDTDNLTKHVEEQISMAIESADLIVLVLDTRSGILPLDQEVAKRLRLVQVPIVCVANKADDHTFDSAADDFHRLGFGGAGESQHQAKS